MDYALVLTQAGLMATILGICIAVAQYFNGKHIKSGVNSILERMDEGFRKMDEGFRKMDERRSEEHKEVIKLIETITLRNSQMEERMEKRAEQRHMEVVKLLEMGFGGLAKSIK